MPPDARSNRPGWELAAPVYAPRSTPKRSASTRVSGMAAQFTDTNGLEARERSKFKLDYVVTENANDKNIPIGGKLDLYNAST